MRYVTDTTTARIIAAYRSAVADAIDHSDHGCPVAVLAVGRAGALAMVLAALGVDEAEANGPDLGAAMTSALDRLSGEFAAPVAVTAVPVDDQPPTPDAPPVDAVDVDTFDADAFLSSLGLTDDADRFGGDR